MAKKLEVEFYEYPEGYWFVRILDLHPIYGRLGPFANIDLATASLLSLTKIEQKQLISNIILGNTNICIKDIDFT